MAELLRRVTWPEVVEQMAYEQIEPYGSLHDEFMAGQHCAIVANVHRDPKKGDAYTGSDFMPALGKSLGKSDEPILLDDPDEHAELIVRFFTRVGTSDE